MSIDSVNLVNIDKNKKVHLPKTVFNETESEQIEKKDNTGMIVAGLAAAAAIGIATCMLIKGRGAKALEGVQSDSTSVAGDVTNAISSGVSVKPPEVKNFAFPSKEAIAQKIEDIAKKFGIKNYVAADKLTEINGLYYVDGKLYSGKAICVNILCPPSIYRFKDGKMVLKRELFNKNCSVVGPIEVWVQREGDGVYSTCSYTFDEKGKCKIGHKWEHSKLVPPEEKYLKAKSIGDISQHSYKEIPEIGCVTSGYNKDFTFYKTSVDAVNPWEIYKKIDYNELRDSGKFILAVGKNQQGKPVVFYHSPAGRVDEACRGIRNIVTLATKEDKLSESQLDLIRAIVGQDKDALQKELPLSRAFSVNYSQIDETINIDENTLLNEIAHFSKGRNIDSKTQEFLDDFAKMPNNTYKRIFEMNER